MSIDLSHFSRIRPWLYHVTARENLLPLTRGRLLQPAADLMRAAGRTDLLRWPRPDAVRLTIDGETVVLKDQRPLNPRNAEFEGCSFEEFVEYLNSHVFFWPGRDDGPINAGARLQAHYESTSPLVLRVRTEELLADNPAAVPLFCRYNSGAPRQQGGRRVRRSLNLFAPPDAFGLPERDVVEVAFQASVRLPSRTEIREGDGWIPLPEASIDAIQQ